MDFDQNTLKILSLLSIILLFVLNAHKALLTLVEGQHDDNDDGQDGHVLEFPKSSIAMTTAATMATLQHFRLFHTLAGMDEDLGFEDETKVNLVFHVHSSRVQ